MSKLMKIEAIPNYKEIEVVGISKRVLSEFVNGTVERNKFTGRRILTLEERFDPASNDDDAPAHKIALGDGSRRIQTVVKHDTFAVRIALGDGFKSRKLELKNVLVCKDTQDNKGATLVFIKEDSDDCVQVLDKVQEFAPKMLAAHPDAFGDWNLIADDESRVFVYTYGDVDPKTGKGIPQD